MLQVLPPNIVQHLWLLPYPFSHFLKGSEVIKNIQDAINLVWPSTDYEIQWLDVACSKVRGIPPCFCMTL